MRTRLVKYLIPIIVIFGMHLIGCDQILEPEPIGQATLDNVYKDVPGIISGINAVYSPLRTYGAYERTIPAMAGLASDDEWTCCNEEFKRFETNEGEDWVQGLWDEHFKGIARSNVILSKLPAVEFSSKQASLKESIQGQALFLRALYYFNLVRFFGDVPLYITELEDPNDAAIPRTPTEEVFAQIEDDLKEAAKLLPRKSELDGSSGWEQGRATSGAATSLLAKVYLTQEKWAESARAAQEVIDSGEYGLFSDYADNFQGRSENGIESAFEVQFTHEGETDTGSRQNNWFGPSELTSGRGAQFQIPTNDTLDFDFAGVSGNGIVQAFETGDLRKDVAMSNYGLPSFFNPESGGLRTPLINKYFTGKEFPRNNGPVNYPVLRYAEVLLIRAEALNELGRTAEASAPVNQVRARAGLDPLPDKIVSDQDAFRKAIWHERRVELCFESKRFFDLNRTARLQESMEVQGIHIDPAKITPHPITDKPQYLYAIPLSEMSTNAEMTQNPGY